MRQDQYVIKMAYKQPMTCLNGIKNFSSMSFDNNIQTCCIPDLNINKNPIPPIGGGLPIQKEQLRLQLLVIST